MMTVSTVFGAGTLLGYIGPGGGIALLGPLQGVVLAALGALAMVALFFWTSGSPAMNSPRKIRQSQDPGRSRQARLPICLQNKSMDKS